MVRHAALASSLFLAAAGAAHAGPARACVEESEKIVGRRAVLVGKDFPSPRKLQEAPLEFPTRQGSTKAVSSMWLGDALVDQDGKVRAVWTIRPLRFEPAWPEFDEAIAANIRQRTYEPATVDGQAVPFCLTVSVLIHWR